MPGRGEVLRDYLGEVDRSKMNNGHKRWTY